MSFFLRLLFCKYVTIFNSTELIRLYSSSSPSSIRDVLAIVRHPDAYPHGRRIARGFEGDADPPLHDESLQQQLARGHGSVSLPIRGPEADVAVHVYH